MPSGLYFLRQCRVRPSAKGEDGEEGVKVEGRGGMEGVEREAAGETEGQLGRADWRSETANAKATYFGVCSSLAKFSSSGSSTESAMGGFNHDWGFAKLLY